MARPLAQQLQHHRALDARRTCQTLLCLGLMSLIWTSPPAVAQSLEAVARDYVDWYWSQNPLTQLIGRRCDRVLEGTPHAPTVENCNRLRNFAYQYWRSTYGPSGPRFP